MKKNHYQKIIIFFFSLLMSAAYAADITDFSEKPSLQWENVSGAKSYLIEIKDSSGKLILKKKTTDTSIEIPLESGSYKVRVSPINKFSKIEYSETWEELNISESSVPVVKSASPDTITGDEKSIKLTIKGDKFYDGLSVTIKSSSQKFKFTDPILKNKETLELTLDPSSLKDGQYDIQVTNKGNLTGTGKNKLTVNKSPKAEIKSEKSTNLKKEVNNDLINFVSSGNLEKVKEAIESGVSPNATDSKGFTAAHYAASRGYLLILKYLDLKGADLNATDYANATPLHHAAFKGHLFIVKFLVENKFADVNKKTNKGYTPLDRAAIKANSTVVKFFLSKKANVNSFSNQGETPLHMACYSGDLESVKAIISIPGCMINAKEYRGFTPLHYASYFGYKDIVAALIAKKADINILSEKGYTPLMMAKFASQLDTADYLILNGAK